MLKRVTYNVSGDEVDTLKTDAKFVGHPLNENRENASSIGSGNENN